MNSGHTTHIPQRGEGRGDVAVVPHFLAHPWGCGSLVWVMWRSRDGQGVYAVMWRSCGAHLAVVGVRRQLLAAGRVLGGGKWVGDVAGGGICTGNRNGGANPPSRVALSSPLVSALSRLPPCVFLACRCECCGGAHCCCPGFIRRQLVRHWHVTFVTWHSCAAGLSSVNVREGAAGLLTWGAGDMAGRREAGTMMGGGGWWW